MRCKAERTITLKNEGLEHIAKLVGLEGLHIRYTEVTDKGMPSLAGLTNLTHLDMSQTQVTDAGLKHLEKLAGLRTLIVRGNQNISAAGVRIARKNNPKLLVTGP